MDLDELTILSSRMLKKSEIFQYFLPYCPGLGEGPLA